MLKSPETEWGGEKSGIRGQLIFSVKSQSNTANPHCQAGASMQTWIRPHPEHPCPQGTSTQLLLDGKSFVKSFATYQPRNVEHSIHTIQYFCYVTYFLAVLLHVFRHCCVKISTTSRIQTFCVGRSKSHGATSACGLFGSSL